ncbi:diacylglycerol/lipid kinase family protein [Gimibacter soli]|uniref:Diacylglycerol kinase family protein n=1 Tax=Gimibacter soli TaxID=3024400 RepID=A0AAF0BLA1_9PROT|nr:diacylglycerol kinase family protein [Gimibacter soli]WCL53220.1 diacylglycerol kinase family protein [Gimibacter soli]
MQHERHIVEEGKSGILLVGILSNPRSSTNAEGMSRIRSIVDATPHVIHFELDGIESIDEGLALFARAGVGLVVINGGDGTIGAVLAALLYRNPFKSTPPVSFLPGGKTNMTAADLGAKGRPDAVLKKLLRLAAFGKVDDNLTSRQLIELDLGDGSHPKVGTFFGTAGIVKGIFWCRENAYSLGLPNWMAHLWSAFKLISSAAGLGKDRNLMASEPMQLDVRGRVTLTGRFAIVTATTLDRLLFGLRPYAEDGLGGLRFAAVEFGGANVWRGMRDLLTGVFGRRPAEGVHTYCGDEILIEGSDPMTLDGEIYTPIPGRPVVLRGDKCLTFVRL